MKDLSVSWQYTNGIFTLNNNGLQHFILAFFSLEVRSLFWTEFSNVKRTNLSKFIETGAVIFASLRARIIFIFTRASRECQRRQKQGDVLIFRAFFVFTRLITHAQFKICRTCALKNRKPKKWHPVFDYPRVRGISIPLTVNARGLWGRDCTRPITHIQIHIQFDTAAKWVRMLGFLAGHFRVSGYDQKAFITEKVPVLCSS